MRFHRNPAVLELGPRSVWPLISNHRTNRIILDSADVFNSPIFLDTNSESGFGGWGDPENDFEVPDGGFSPSSSFALAYPSPHTLRRNFTSQPFGNSLYLSDADRTLAPNETFTPAERDKLVHGFVGEYAGFQTYLEGFNVLFSFFFLWKATT